jgi:hypothetical protein
MCYKLSVLWIVNIFIGRGLNGKVKFHPITGHEGPEGE